MSDPAMELQESRPRLASLKKRARLGWFRQFLVSWWPFIVITITWLTICYGLITGQQVVAFRDSGNLYYPLFKAIDQAWQSGTVPLLNPYCDFGFPLVADGSSSVFYPGKLVFHLRFLSYPSRYGIYLSGHLLLAALSTYWLARRFKCDRCGATIAALSYAFGGPVLFQTTNVIYLVSAAWLPIAFYCVWRLLSEGSIRWTMVGAICCSMMILGGDPQMTYNVGLIALVSVVAISALGLIRAVAKTDWRNAAQTLAWSWRRMICISALVAVTFLLSAIQVLPTAKLAMRSERVKADSQETGTEGQFQFSQPPWSLVEMAIPNFSGKPFPINTRWQSKLDASDRMWFPSLYLGTLTLIVAIAGLQFRGNSRATWLTWLAIWFLFASFGWFGAMWLLRETQLLLGFEVNLNPDENPIGGVYWFMSQTFPLFGSFRYPAKLFIVANLAMSLLAGFGAKRMVRCRMFWFLLPIFVLAVSSPFVIEFWFRDWVANLAMAPYSPKEIVEFGPLVPERCCWELYQSSIQLAVVVALTTGAMYQFSNRKIGPHAFGCCIATVLALDLIFANHWLTGTVPSQVFESDTMLQSERLQPFHLNSTHQETYGWLADNRIPINFLNQSSDNRLSQLVRWDRETLRAKHHLPEQRRLIGSFHSIVLKDYRHRIESLCARQEQRFFQLGLQSGDLAWNQATFEIETDTLDAFYGSEYSMNNHQITLPLFGSSGWTGTATEIGGDRKLTLGRSELLIEDDLQTVILPKGKWEINLEYKPIEFLIGAWISVIAWIGMIGTWGYLRTYLPKNQRVGSAKNENSFLATDERG